MNSSIKYIKSKENCTGNNPWANDTMEDVQEGIDQNKLNGYESANYLPLLMGDEVPVKAPEWIIHLPGMNEDDMRIIILWLLLDPPSPDDSEETAIRLLMSEAKQYHDDDDLHNRLESIISTTHTVDDTTTTVTNWKEDAILQHFKIMCDSGIILLANQMYIDCINSCVETNWNNHQIKNVRMMNKMVKMGIAEKVADDHDDYSKSEEFVPSSELEEYATSSISTQHTLHVSQSVIQTNDNNESVMIGSRNGGYAHPLNGTNNGETAEHDLEIITMTNQRMMSEMAHEEMVEEIGISQTAHLMTLPRCYKRRRKSTINLRLEQLRLSKFIRGEGRKGVSFKAETCRQTDGEWHRPKHGTTRVTSKCNQQRMLSSLARILLEEIDYHLRKKGLGC